MSEKDKQPTCEERIQVQYANTIDELRKLWRRYCNGKDENGFPEYGLAFDYVAPFTFPDQSAGYYRYQLSWGGPSDEFRFYIGAGKQVKRVEYWFMDWYDGASLELEGKDLQLLEEIFQWFDDVGCVQAEYEKAMEE